MTHRTSQSYVPARNNEDDACVELREDDLNQELHVRGVDGQDPFFLTVDGS